MVRLDDLIARKKYLEKVMSYSVKNLKSAPEGVLRCARDGSTWHYFIREPGEKGNGKYLDKSQEKLIKRLAQKKYLEQLKIKAENELKCIDKIIKQYEKGRVEDIYFNYCDGLQKVINPISMPNQKFIEKWLHTEYQTNEFYDDTKTYKSMSGERMRSKSEVLIANMLARNGIPYLYEKPIELEGLGTVYPDFTLLDIETRQEIYWEHLGLMDDSIYSERATQKIQAYASNGVYPGDRLILTFESRRYPIDIENIEKMILKRMDAYING